MTARTKIAWIDLIRPLDHEFSSRAPTVETRLEAFRWLVERAVRHDALATMRNSTYAAGNGYSYPVLTREYFDEVRAIVSHLLLDRVPQGAGGWCYEDDIRVGVCRNLPFRSYKSGDDQIRHRLCAIFDLKGKHTLYSWNPIHPKAREVQDVYLRPMEDGWAWHVGYGEDGSSWHRWFHSKKKESLRAFLRRVTPALILGARPERDTPYRRWMGNGADGSFIAMKWRNQWGPEHVHFDPSIEPPVFRCARCGKEQAQPMPIPFDEVAKNLEAFDDKHRSCWEQP